MLQANSGVRVRQASTPASWSRQVSAPSAHDASGRDAGTQITIRRGELVFDEGDPAIYLYRLQKGSMRLCRVLADGHRQICDFLLSGDLVGLAQGDAYEFSAEAIEDCTLIRYRRSAVSALMNENGAFACEIQELTANGLHAAYEHMVQLCHRSARDRIARFLLTMAKRSPNTDLLHLPMTRCDIADYLGMAHETASRAFAQLKKSGAISELAINQIRILSPKALAA